MYAANNYKIWGHWRSKTGFYFVTSSQRIRRTSEGKPTLPVGTRPWDWLVVTLAGHILCKRGTTSVWTRKQPFMGDHGLLKTKTVGEA